GAGSAATVIPIQQTIARAGYEAAFLWFELGQALIVLLCGLVVRFPSVDELRPGDGPKLLASGRDYTPREVIRSPAFWLLYAMMSVGAIPGLFMTEQMAPMAKDFGVSDVPVTLFGITLRALSFAVMLDRITGGLTRPIF